MELASTAAACPASQRCEKVSRKATSVASLFSDSSQLVPLLVGAVARAQCYICSPLNRGCGRCFAAGSGISSGLASLFSFLVPFAFLVFVCMEHATATLLTGVIAGSKPPSMKKCIDTAQRELNLAALPSTCHKEITSFYCAKVRDVSSRRYRESFRGGCNESDGDVISPNMEHVSFEPPGIGYVILMHRFPDSVKRLIMRLYEPDLTAFAVHVDEKSLTEFQEMTAWRKSEQMEDVVDVFSEFNVVRGGPAMLQAELKGIQALLNSTIPWSFCILLSEQDYPLRSNRVLFEWLFAHRGTNFVSVDEGECERDVSFQCRDRVVSLSGGSQYPKIPGMRYGSGSQWFAITRALAATVVSDMANTRTVLGVVYRDLTSVKQPDESFFQAAILNTRFCSEHLDYTLHWTDKGGMREVQSLTSDFRILSPGVLQSGADFFKIAEVRKQSLWAFFARKFDSSRDSMQLKNRLDHASGENGKPVWHSVSVPSVHRLVEVLVSSLGQVEEVSRADRNKDGLYALQTLRVRMKPRRPGEVGRIVFLRERLAMPEKPHQVVALRVGCSLNKTELAFDGDFSTVSASPTGRFGCNSLWAVAYWRMSRRPLSKELVLVWVDPGGTPMQHAPVSVSESSVVLWHRYTATLPLPRGFWTLQIMTPTRRVLMQRRFFVYGVPSEIPWAAAQLYFEVLAEDPMG
eukprot:TRINITY_DN19781_c0_g1_i1.p1 TRINITY_DN19781_c0_g1~~TRINITY_DN19781_c0_g1_i1.p1  ORF type:complete len:689 (-),score=90.87 TRINITY_DN19781_c0_g1_i1:478-2544(-)